MSWFRGGKQLGVVAAAAGGSVVGFLLGRDERRVSVDASWTTGHTPSVKWDWNWDRYSLLLYSLSISFILFGIMKDEFSSHL